MGYIHVGCLKHWLDTTRQQGRARRIVNRCEICHSKYKTGRSSLDEADQLQLMPSPLHDPFTVASIIHGSYRAYVALSGLLKAYAIYKSIEFRACPSSTAVSTSSGVGGFGMSSSTGSSWRIRGPRWQQPQQQRRELPLRHLSVSIPIGGGHVQQPESAEVLAEVRNRFDKATMVQVSISMSYTACRSRLVPVDSLHWPWFTGLLHASPQHVAACYARCFVLLLHLKLSGASRSQAVPVVCCVL